MTTPLLQQALEALEFAQRFIKIRCSDIGDAGVEEAITAIRAHLEEPKGGPVAEVIGAYSNGREVQTIAVDRRLPKGTKLFASPPSDTVSRDVARYRWLRETHPIEWPISLHADAILAPDYFDAEVDTAMAAQNGGAA